MNFVINKQLLLAIISTLVFGLYIAFVLSRVIGCFTLETGSNSLGLSFYYTKDMVHNFFELRSPEQLVCYSEFLQIWDAIFALIYTLMYASWIAYFLNHKNLFLIIPVLAMVCDWFENYLELLMLATYLESNLISATLVSLGSGINSSKWILSSLTYLVICYGIIITVFKFIRKPKLN